MSDFEHLQHAFDLKPDVIRAAVEERDGARARLLMERLEAISKPNEKIGNTVLLLAAMSRYARWLPDKLHVQFVRQGKTTVLDLLIPAGDTYERFWRKFKLNAPLDEFVPIIEKLGQRGECPFQITRKITNGKVDAIMMNMVTHVRSLTLPPIINRMPPKHRTGPGMDEVPPSKVPVSQGPPTEDIDSEW